MQLSVLISVFWPVCCLSVAKVYFGVAKQSFTLQSKPLLGWLLTVTASKKTQIASVQDQNQAVQYNTVFVNEVQDCTNAIDHATHSSFYKWSETLRRSSISSQMITSMSISLTALFTIAQLGECNCEHERATSCLYMIVVSNMLPTPQLRSFTMVW